MNNYELLDVLTKAQPSFEAMFQVVETQEENWEQNEETRRLLLKTLFVLLKDFSIPFATRDDLLNIEFVLYTFNTHIADNLDKLISAAIEQGELEL